MNTNVCDKCGKENPNHFQFCRSCNNKLIENEDMANIEVPPSEVLWHSYCIYCRIRVEHSLSEKGKGVVTCEHCSGKYYVEMFWLVTKGGQRRDSEGNKEYRMRVKDAADGQKILEFLTDKDLVDFQAGDEITCHYRYNDKTRKYGRLEWIVDWTVDRYHYIPLGSPPPVKSNPLEKPKPDSISALSTIKSIISPSYSDGSPNGWIALGYTIGFIVLGGNFLENLFFPLALINIIIFVVRKIQHRN